MRLHLPLKTLSTVSKSHKIAEKSSECHRDLRSSFQTREVGFGFLLGSENDIIDGVSGELKKVGTEPSL